MNLEKVNLIQVLISIKIKISGQQVVNITRSIEDARKQLTAGTIYHEELVLLKILEDRVKEKVSRARGYIVKLEGLRYDRRLQETSNYFKEIDIIDVRSFIRSNDFDQVLKEWETIEYVIAKAFCEKYLNL